MFESKCSHGCGRLGSRQHADGRMLCALCYWAEGNEENGVWGCPTCGPDTERVSLKAVPDSTPVSREVMEHMRRHDYDGQGKSEWDEVEGSMAIIAYGVVVIGLIILIVIGVHYA